MSTWGYLNKEEFCENGGSKWVAYQNTKISEKQNKIGMLKNVNKALYSLKRKNFHTIKIKFYETVRYNFSSEFKSALS